MLILLSCGKVLQRYQLATLDPQSRRMQKLVTCFMQLA